MKMKTFLCLLLLAVATSHTFQTKLSSKDRMQVINNVLARVKARATEKAEAPVKAAHSARHRPAKSYNQDMLQTARARVNYERAVRLAEAEMVKLEFKEELEGDDKTAKAQALATVALHTPGSLLTTSELVHIQSELNAACRDNLPIPNCNPNDRFRTFDGTCNNLANPIQGAFRTPLRRILPQRFEDGIQQPRGAFQARDADILGRGPFQAPNPSSRLVVSTIHQSVPIDDPVHSHMLMQFGQFLDHDFAVTPEFPDANCDEDECAFSEECLPIRVSSNDPVFGAGPNDPERCLFFARSLPVCDRTGEIGVRNVFNDITSYIDASMVYGSEPARARFLREFRGGRLRVGPAALRNGQPSLPTMSEAEAQQADLFTFCARGGCFAAGDPRPNEQLGLTMIHTIFMREHNRVATALGNINPQWDDETIFQNARAIVIGEFQAMVYEEFLPTLFGRELFETLIGPFQGYDDTVDASIPAIFATAGFRFGHSLIRSAFGRLDENGNPLNIGPLPLVDAFLNPQLFNVSRGTDPILRGLLAEPSKRADEFITATLTSNLFRAGRDLITLNVQRGRDHGLPPYPIWRDFCRNFLSDRGIETLPGVNFRNQLAQVLIQQLYGSFDSADAFTGMLSELPLSGANTESILGPTLACIFAITFNDLRAGDRFFYENPGVFTPAQVAELKSASLSRVICDNADNIPRIQRSAMRLPNAANNPVVDCTSLPTPNLELWKENRPRCFARMSALGILPTGFLLLSSARNDDQLGRQQDAIPFDNLNTVRCFEFECPDVFTQVAVVPSVPNICTVTQNVRLPPSTARNADTYEGIWSAQALQQQNGIFRNEATCLGNAANALLFSCPGAPLTVISEVTDGNSNQNDKDSLVNALETALDELQ